MQILFIYSLPGGGPGPKHAAYQGHIYLAGRTMGCGSL
jgi:hypothetical protein